MAARRSHGSRPSRSAPRSIASRSSHFRRPASRGTEPGLEVGSKGLVRHVGPGRIEPVQESQPGPYSPGRLAPGQPMDAHPSDLLKQDSGYSVGIRVGLRTPLNHDGSQPPLASRHDGPGRVVPTQYLFPPNVVGEVSFDIPER